MESNSNTGGGRVSSSAVVAKLGDTDDLGLEPKKLWPAQATDFWEL